MPRKEDVHVGTRIRLRRHVLGMTQQDVAEKLGVKFQQLQKYETGANRVSASRLYDLSKVFDVSPSFFFEGLDHPVPAQELRSKTENDLIKFFRQSRTEAQASLLGIAKATAQASA